MPRISLDFWIPAYIRRVEQAGGYASVLEKGGSQEGEVIILIRNTANEMHVYQPVNGAQLRESSYRKWQRTHALQDLDVIREFDQKLMRMKQRDPDLWVIEVLSKNLLSFLNDDEVLSAQ